MQGTQVSERRRKVTTLTSTALVAEGPTIFSEKTLRCPSLWCPGL